MYQLEALLISLFLFFWGLLQEHLLGFCSHTILKKVHIRDTSKVIIILKN